MHTLSLNICDFIFINNQKIYGPKKKIAVNIRIYPKQ